MNVAALILAAGSSSRMGRSKQMLDIHGERLLERTTKTVLASGIRDVVVVLGADKDVHRQILASLPVTTVENDDWAKGMGSSIKCGLRHLTHVGTDYHGVLIFVCDQPLLTSEVISTILHTFRQTKKPIIASAYSNVPGVPVLFERSYFEKLMALPDDHGAKKVIQQNPSDVVTVPFPGGEIDLDTMQDYDAFMQGRSEIS